MEDLKLYALDYRGAVLHEDAQEAWDELEAYVAGIVSNAVEAEREACAAKAEQVGATIVVPDPLQRDFVEKFAELIVRECMEVAGDSYTSTPEDCVYYVDLAVNRIAEHFGVE